MERLPPGPWAARYQEGDHDLFRRYQNPSRRSTRDTRTPRQLQHGERAPLCHGVARQGGGSRAGAGPYQFPAICQGDHPHRAGPRLWPVAGVAGYQRQDSPLGDAHAHAGSQGRRGSIWSAGRKRAQLHQHEQKESAARLPNELPTASQDHLCRAYRLAQAGLRVAQRQPGAGCQRGDPAIHRLCE
ncbi:hypothetical protein D3C75_591630 [compost metagenome]